MKHPVLITLLVIVAVAILLILFIHPEWIEKAWLWVIGLTGTIVAAFKKFWNKISEPKSTIKDIETNNDEIKKQIKQLEDQIKATNDRMETERKLYQKDIELLNQKIQMKDLEIQLWEEKRKSLENKTWKEYYNDLSEEEKRSILENEERNNIDIN